jgi:hypothetical protein
MRKKKKPIKVTIKQKLAFAKVVENGGNISKAMRDVGYSPETASTPQKLTQSKGWEELMKEYLPDDLLAKKHRELLTVPRRVRKYIKGDLLSETEELDTNAVKAGLDMAYKIKGAYEKDNEQRTPVVYNIMKYGNNDTLQLDTREPPSPNPEQQRTL